MALPVAWFTLGLPEHALGWFLLGLGLDIHVHRCASSKFNFLIQLSWSPDGKQLLTASGDKSCKVWDVETQKVVT